MNKRMVYTSIAAVLFGTTAIIGDAYAAKGGIPGPPTGGETSNNLSLPAVQTESVNSIVANWSTPAEPVLGVHYSYGCDQPESMDIFNYPNTSCVDSLSDPMLYLDAAACTAAGAPCEGLPVDRIYWQKVDVNEWWADDDGISPEPGYVAYVDWGDALEAVSWNERSVIRVETQPYSSTLDSFAPSETCENAAVAAGAITDLEVAAFCKVGLQMWHVSGQGITEHWGVRASDEEGELTPATSYNYDSPFQIIKSSNARLNLAKLVPGDALCAQPGGNPGDPSPGASSWTGSEWEGTCTWYDAPYSVETSVGGKYVYGYNWRMDGVDLELSCPGWVKTGFWRLTFYAPEDVMFDDPEAPNVAPPAVPSGVRTLPRCDVVTEECVFNTVITTPEEPLPVTEDEDPDADDRLYKPVVDTTNNLTYLDICIVAKEQGGGGGGGGGGQGGQPAGGASGGGGNPNR